jgi:3,4-dihydroxy 2-butanone 4-phosphate synthase/GTP cyclohydrolase II
MARAKSPYVVGIDEALAELRAGRMIILMDDEDRENEGDLCVPADRVTAEHINFMATHGRGLICLSLTEQQCDRLGLPMMVSENRAPLGTAFTVSIDARQGIGRGLSAADRATTIRTAARPDAVATDVVTPGHIFPLRARRGGVLGAAPGRPRRRSTSRASRASRPPASSARSCATTARWRACRTCRRSPRGHSLKIATIADLIHYRSRHDSLVHRMAEARITSRYGGEFRHLVYTTDVDDGEHLVLVKGDIRPGRADARAPARRVHARATCSAIASATRGACLTGRWSASPAEGRGVVLYLPPRARRARPLHARCGGGRHRAQHEPALASLDVPRLRHRRADPARHRRRKIRWLTNNPLRLASLPGYGLQIVESVPLTLEDADAPPPAPSATTGKVLRLR